MEAFYLSKKIENLIESIVKDPIESNGFELADIEFKKEGDDFVLTIFIHKETGVSIDDCETISRLIEPMIDEKDPISDQYFLSVSSVGLDRALKKASDYKRNIGKELVLRLYAPLNGKKEYIGTLACFDEEKCTLNCNGSDISINFAAIASAKPYIDFSKL